MSRNGQITGGEAGYAIALARVRNVVRGLESSARACVKAGETAAGEFDQAFDAGFAFGLAAAIRALNATILSGDNDLPQHGRPVQGTEAQQPTAGGAP